MRVLVIGASGVIGRELVPRLVAAGHEVVGTTRSGRGAADLENLGVAAAIFDAYADSAAELLTRTEPDVMVCELTDLPDRADDLPARRSANARIRREVIPRLVGVAASAGVRHILVQSVAWPMQGEGADAVAVMERATLDAGGVVLRYGQFYGPGTFHAERPEGPAITPADAAARTVDLLTAAPEIVTVTASS